MTRTERKKILVVDLGDVMGGVEYYIETLSGMLRERATLLSLCVPPELARRLRSKGIRGLFAPSLSLVRKLSVSCLRFRRAPYHHSSRARTDRPCEWLSGVSSFDSGAPSWDAKRFTHGTVHLKMISISGTANPSPLFSSLDCASLRAVCLPRDLCL